MIENYWNEVFGQFKESSGKFNIPGFPEPLMSAHFGVKNIIGPTEGEIHQSFKLCILPALKDINQKERESYSETLSEAMASEKFWDYQKQQPSYPFIQKLLPFLISLPQPHYHFFLKEGDEILASALIGVAQSGCFFFNLSVSSKARGRGYAKLLHHEIRDSFPGKAAFYWTVHPWFTFDSQVQDYHILK